MFDNLISVGVGAVIFIVVVAVGLVVTDKFAGSQCQGNYNYYNETSNVCQNGSTANAPTNTSTPSEVSTVVTLKGYLGTSSGGLGAWTPAVIALVIGVLFIGAIMSLRGKQY